MRFSYKEFLLVICCLSLGFLYSEEQKSLVHDSQVDEKKCKNNVAKNIANASNSVVNIYVTVVHENPTGLFVNDPVFRYFFDADLPYQSRIERGSGSGVIIDEDGLIATCAHVAQDAPTIKVKLNDGRTFTAEKDYIDSYFDVAFYRIKKTNNEVFPSVKISSSNTLELTQTLYAIGNAFNIGQSITRGIVSAKRRIIEGRLVIQTDAAVNPGNSGGAVFNEAGEYIGMPSAIATKTGASHGVGFIIPSDVIQKLLKKRLDKTLDEFLWTGLTFQDLTYELSKGFDGFNYAEHQGGVIVTAIDEQSPFFGKMQKGDIIVSVDGINALTKEIIDYFVKIHNIQDDFQLTIWRQKSGIINVSQKLKNIPESAQGEKIRLTGDHLLNDVVVGMANQYFIEKEDLNPELKGRIVVFEVPKNQSKNMFGFSFYVGDEILKINNHTVKDLKKISEIIKNGIQSIVMRRGNQILSFNQS